MTAVRTAFALVPFRRPTLAQVAATTGLMAAAFLLGVGLSFFASWFKDYSPLVLLVLPLAPILAIAIMARPFIGVMTVVATLPFGVVGLQAGPATLQVTEMAVLVVGSLVVLRRLSRGETPLPWSPLFAFPLALLAWTLVALYSAIDETLAVKQIAALVGGVIFASVVVASCRGIDDVRRVCAALVGVGALISVLAVASGGARFTSTYGGSAVQGRLEGAFTSPNQLGAYCALAAALAVGLAAGSRSARGRWASTFALPVLLLALALSLSRGAWLGTAAAFLFMIITMREARRMLFLFAVPVVVLGFVVWTSQSDRPEFKVVGERAQAIAKRSPYDGRDQIWAEAIREIKADPVTGQGPGSFPLASVRAGSEASSVYPDHAHNLFLNWAAETGIPAVLIIVSFIFALGVATRRASQGAVARGDPRDRAIVLGVAAALITVVGQGFFDYVLTNAVLHITVWGVIGALIVCAREARRTEAPV